MSLIELIVYIALVISFVVGGFFSSYSMLISVSHDADRLDSGSQQSGGFVALISATVISLMLLLAAVGFSQKTSALYDSVARSEYRQIVRGRTYACFSLAIERIASDYWYVPAPGGDQVLELGCTIDSVSSPDADHRQIAVSSAYLGIRGSMTGLVELGTHQIRILQQNFMLF